MSGEKTEQPTEKRLREGRKKGRIPKSQDLTSALMLLTAVLIFWLGGKITAASLLRVTQRGIETAGSFTGALTRERAAEMLSQAVIDAGVILAPLFVFMFLGGILFNYVQIGSLPAFERIKPDSGKLNPAENFRQKFLKANSYIELATALLKSCVAFIVVGVVLDGEIPNIVKLAAQPAVISIAYLFDLILRVGFCVGILFLGLAIGDFFLQRWLFIRQMKMSKQEARRESKESEGDPLIKRMRKNLHREILAQSLIAAVKTADVVLISPAHLAVALKYDRTKMNSPTVVAKGADLLAEQIRKIAEEHGVPLMRRIPLARALYEIDIDAEIPEEMYEAVAEVLRAVYASNEQKKDAANDGEN